jgi:Cu(I)/Ag(I) efflux system membrane fusion protein
MSISNMLSKKEFRSGVIFIIVGLILGWFIFGGTPESSIEKLEETHAHEANTEYTCSMHPQIRQDAPGSCPICGMDLIPLENDSEEDDGGDYTIRLTNSAMKIAEVSTSKIFKKSPHKTLHLSGKVMADERSISEITARYPGRIEKLLVNYTGQVVKKGEVLARIYSPEIITAQKELFEAVKFKQSNANYYKAARNKLKLWGISEQQIASIEESGKTQFSFNILSPLSGTVTMRHTSLGDYVKEGTSLFEIMDLSKVWVVFDAYESDMPWIKRRDKINFSIPSIPNKIFESTVTFIDPVMDAQSRVVGIRTEISNNKGLLKPQMLASGKLQAMLPGNKEVLLVPKSAILWTGKNAVVYVRTDNKKNLFQYREIQIGTDAGEYYVVAGGLDEGELVASNGVFKIDAAAQLKGEQSMMNPMGGKAEMNVNISVSSQVISLEFKNQIKEVLGKYLELKDDLVNSDQKETMRRAENLATSLLAVDMKLVKGNAHMEWMKFLTVLNTEAGKIKKSNKIEAQRAAFLPLSEALYGTLKYFKIDGVNAYYQFCPMANNNQGANWLSITEEIRNPYFGDAMLSCGETQEILN